MHVAFVIPPSPGRRKIIRLIDCSHEAKADYLWQPGDFMIISSLLASEDRASLIDGTADGLQEEEFFRQVGDIRPDLVFFALSGVCWESDYCYFNKVRQHFKSLPFYVIGDIFQEQDYLPFILRQCNGVVVNPFLLELEKMADMGRNRPAAFRGVRTKPENTRDGEKRVTFVDSNSPRHELFQKRGYGFPFARHFRFTSVTTMWGCPFSCSYCPDSNFPPFVRKWEDVVRELYSVHSLGIKELFFADKTFGYPRDNAVHLLREMAGKFNFSWSCHLHPNMYDKDLLELMRSAGCHTLIVGIDSADPDSLKRYHRRVEMSRIDGLISHADRLGMSVCADFILGLEHEGEDDILNTIRYALRLPIDFASFNIAAPLPGTIIRRKAMQSGKMKFGVGGYDTLSHKGDLGISSVSHERVRRLRNQAVRRFYLRPSYLLRRLGKTVSLEHLLVQLSQMQALFRKTGHASPCWNEEEATGVVADKAGTCMVNHKKEYITYEQSKETV